MTRKMQTRQSSESSLCKILESGLAKTTIDIGCKIDTVKELQVRYCWASSWSMLIRCDVSIAVAEYFIRFLLSVVDGKLTIEISVLEIEDVVFKLVLGNSDSNMWSVSWLVCYGNVEAYIERAVPETIAHYHHMIRILNEVAVPESSYNPALQNILTTVTDSVPCAVNDDKLLNNVQNLIHEDLEYTFDDLKLACDIEACNITRSSMPTDVLRNICTAATPLYRPNVDCEKQIQERMQVDLPQNCEPMPEMRNGSWHALV